MTHKRNIQIICPENIKVTLLDKLWIFPLAIFIFLVILIAGRFHKRW